MSWGKTTLTISSTINLSASALLPCKSTSEVI